jgi:hypothetical protein
METPNEISTPLEQQMLLLEKRINRKAQTMFRMEEVALTWLLHLRRQPRGDIYTEAAIGKLEALMSHEMSQGHKTTPSSDLLRRPPPSPTALPIMVCRLESAYVAAFQEYICLLNMREILHTNEFACGNIRILEEETRDWFRVNPNDSTGTRSAAINPNSILGKATKACATICAEGSNPPLSSTVGKHVLIPASSPPAKAARTCRSAFSPITKASRSAHNTAAEGSTDDENCNAMKVGTSDGNDITPYLQASVNKDKRDRSMRVGERDKRDRSTRVTCGNSDACSTDFNEIAEDNIASANESSHKKGNARSCVKEVVRTKDSLLAKGSDGRPNDSSAVAKGSARANDSSDVAHHDAMEEDGVEIESSPRPNAYAHAKESRVRPNVSGTMVKESQYNDGVIDDDDDDAIDKDDDFQGCYNEEDYSENDSSSCKRSPTDVTASVGKCSNKRLGKGKAEQQTQEHAKVSDRNRRDEMPRLSSSEPGYFEANTMEDLVAISRYGNRHDKTPRLSSSEPGYFEANTMEDLVAISRYRNRRDETHRLSSSEPGYFEANTMEDLVAILRYRNRCDETVQLHHSDGQECSDNSEVEDTSDLIHKRVMAREERLRCRQIIKATSKEKGK